MDLTPPTPNSPDGASPEIAAQAELLMKELNDVNERAMAFIRARPVVCIAGALALGFVIGKIASRV